eukprot:TRINITY_DN9917_c0_g1_i1.p1 TRINITY_DN9917_c0_g1~~TRINITY_DN9917_c0_g1_i1.p1  ORF type:complete len:234 (+),score=68.17 TRINITY_DN9917_c0_g1_i1:60-761(+)
MADEKKVCPRWLPLESNPDMQNGFLRRMGVSSKYEFTDVFGLDEELLAMIPQPCMALCLLYPSDGVSRPRREQYKEKCLPDGKHGAFYLTQHSEFGNACGTIAMVHTVANTGVEMDDASPLKRFIDANKGRGASDVGYALTEMKEVHEASETSAQGGQTATPDRHDKVDNHFICFVNSGGRLLELDGCMAGVIDHGETSQESFVSQAARIVKEDFMARVPGNLNFNLTAFVRQ